MLLTRRYTPAVRKLLQEASTRRREGGRAAAVSGAGLAGGPFATPRRLEHGARERGGQPGRPVHCPADDRRHLGAAALRSPQGVLQLGPDAEDPAQFNQAAQAIPAEPLACVREGREHPLDARRGLYLQRLLDQARLSLG
jgi:hypothetical protein